MANRNDVIKAIAEKKLAKLEADRERVKKHLFYFCEYMELGWREEKKFFKRSRPHLMISTMLFDLVREKVINNLALSEPPGGGKSYKTTRALQMFIAEFPDLSNMRSSYSSGLACDKLSVETRDGIKNNANFRKLYPEIKINYKMQSKKHWGIEGHTNACYSAAGVSGSQTGKDCHGMLVLDDEFSGIGTAYSAAENKRTREWVQSVHLARKRTDLVSEIFCCTRWIENDSIGRIISDDSKHKIFIDYEKWHSKLQAEEVTDELFESVYKELKEEVESLVITPLFDYLVLKIPALIKDETESFCEDIHSTTYYKKKKQSMINNDQEFIWQAEFMQDPQPIGGLLLDNINIFFKGDISAYDLEKCVASIDPAFGGGDYYSMPIAKPINGEYHIVDVLYSKKGTLTTIPLTVQKIKKHGIKQIIVEKTNGEFVKRLRESIKKAGLNCYVRTHKSGNTNKTVRVLLSLPDINEKVFFLTKDEYPNKDYEEFMKSIISMPKDVEKAKHDDSIDSIAMLTEIKIGKRSKSIFREW